MKRRHKTIRDEFALKLAPTVAGLITQYYPQGKTVPQLHGAIAELSYSMADAFLGARSPGAAVNKLSTKSHAILKR